MNVVPCPVCLTYPDVERRKPLNPAECRCERLRVWKDMTTFRVTQEELFLLDEDGLSLMEREYPEPWGDRVSLGTGSEMEAMLELAVETALADSVLGE